jgi:hypothetical protein
MARNTGFSSINFFRIISISKLYSIKPLIRVEAVVVLLEEMEPTLLTLIIVCKSLILWKELEIMMILDNHITVPIRVTNSTTLPYFLIH